MDLSVDDMAKATTGTSPRPRGRGGFKPNRDSGAAVAPSPRPRGRGGFKRIQEHRNITRIWVPVREDGVDLSTRVGPRSPSFSVPVREDGVDLSEIFVPDEHDSMVPVREDGVDLSYREEYR